VSDGIVIRRALPADITEVIAIDDDACALYEVAGIRFDFGPDHPFATAEWASWTRATNAGSAFLAVSERLGPRPIGMLVMSRVAGAPHLEQLSVRMSAQRRGIGRRLLMHAIEWAGREPLWLTTYAHLAWNRPFYERHGFVAVPDADCPPAIVAILEEKRRWLPEPHQRIAMRRTLEGLQTPPYHSYP
jgi:GNAT superfamily N-acetyltransferase